jgi:hypothetical protein
MKRPLCGRIAGAALAALAAAVVESGACATCFGAPDHPMTRGLNSGLLTLLAVTYATVIGLPLMFIVMARRARRQAAGAATVP